MARPPFAIHCCRNDSATPRNSVITIGGQPLRITQNGAPFLIASNKTLSCTTAWNFDPPVTADNCETPGSTVTVVSTTTNFGCGRTYVATCVWNAADACGNQVFATQAVTVVSAPPSCSARPDKTVECNSGWTFDLPIRGRILRRDERDHSRFHCRHRYDQWHVRKHKDHYTHVGGSRFLQPDFVVQPDGFRRGYDAATSRIARQIKPSNAGAPGVSTCPAATDLCNGTNVIIRPFSTLTNTVDGCRLYGHARVGNF